mgnify:CR=1 FL=1
MKKQYVLTEKEYTKLVADSVKLELLEKVAKIDDRGVKANIEEFKRYQDGLNMILNMIDGKDCQAISYYIGKNLINLNPQQKLLEIKGRIKLLLREADCIEEKNICKLMFCLER